MGDWTSLLSWVFGAGVYKEDKHGNIILRQGFRPVIHVFIGPMKLAQEHALQFKNCIVYHFSKPLFSHAMSARLVEKFEHGKDIIVICESDNCLGFIPPEFGVLVYEYNSKSRFQESRRVHLDEEYQEFNKEEHEQEFEEYEQEFEEYPEFDNEASWKRADPFGGILWYK